MQLPETLAALIILHHGKGGRELRFVSALAPGCSVVLQVSELASLGLLVVLQQAAS